MSTLVVHPEHLAVLEDSPFVVSRPNHLSICLGLANKLGWEGKCRCGSYCLWTRRCVVHVKLCDPLTIAAIPGDCNPATIFQSQDSGLRIRSGSRDPEIAIISHSTAPYWNFGFGKPSRIPGLGILVLQSLAIRECFCSQILLLRVTTSITFAFFYS